MTAVENSKHNKTAFLAYMFYCRYNPFSGKNYNNWLTFVEVTVMSWWSNLLAHDVHVIIFYGEYRSCFGTQLCSTFFDAVFSQWAFNFIAYNLIKFKSGIAYVFSSLTLLIGRQERHPVCETKIASIASKTLVPLTQVNR